MSRSIHQLMGNQMMSRRQLPLWFPQRRPGNQYRNFPHSHHPQFSHWNHPPHPSMGVPHTGDLTQSRNLTTDTNPGLHSVDLPHVMPPVSADLLPLTGPIHRSTLSLQLIAVDMGATARPEDHLLHILTNTMIITTRLMAVGGFARTLTCAAVIPHRFTDIHHHGRSNSKPNHYRCLLMSLRSQRKGRYRTRTISLERLLQQTSLHPCPIKWYSQEIPLLSMMRCSFKIFLREWWNLKRCNWLRFNRNSTKLLKNLHPRHQSKIVLLIDEAILESAVEIWDTPVSTTLTSKCVDKKYFMPSKGLELLFTHPQPNSLVMDTALQRAKNPQIKNTGADKEAKKLDIFGRKVYSSSTLLLRITNYAALLSNHSFDNIAKLGEIAQRMPESDKMILWAMVQEGYACSRASLQMAMDVADMAARSIATAIAMRRSSWLVTAGVPRELQMKVEDLPFNRTKLFAEKTNEVLHMGKDSRTTLHTLGMYAPPFKRRRYFPFQRRYNYQPRKQQQPPFDQMRLRQRPQHRRPQTSCPTNPASSKRQI
ncbi:uncharacterized protein LOC112545341 [Pelodiscus sinensis]|uniref:uncharacterized protein LOC112545341 n=1 Tax=Pelodiscus sinensis TaxID=13735 RepID=UPI003F6A8C9A